MKWRFDINKTIIYILGTGRTGTTLLGITLSNNPQIFDTGELLKFAKLEGKPHGFSESTPNYLFWQKVKKGFEQNHSSTIDYPKFAKMVDKVEAHRFFLLRYFGGVNGRLNRSYGQYINKLLPTIYNYSGKHVLIDSSKYPGRALALRKCLNENIEVKYIYIKRHPVSVVRSFSNKGIEQPAKGYFFANIYYFVINLFCTLFLFRVDLKDFLIVMYEEFISEPEKTLAKIQDKFAIDLSQSINAVQNDEYLKVGFVFEGNRIRLERELKIKKASIKKDKWSIKNFFTILLNGFWYFKN